ncbi:hypothetical protein [Streptomyces sp. SPB162]|uniref:hypothetical protein n=1 Tax=Streptomyces sp. SPB162 TaxID=2940560 RepID=UPI002405B8CB|nr:hypothetical protein [Streptomyces sp. SPB162]MDF9812554.1 hypothetical protein [Streptomyces sp. SPB162]
MTTRVTPRARRSTRRALCVSVRSGGSKVVPGPDRDPVPVIGIGRIRGRHGCRTGNHGSGSAGTDDVHVPGGLAAGRVALAAVLLPAGLYAAGGLRRRHGGGRRTIARTTAFTVLGLGAIVIATVGRRMRRRSSGLSRIPWRAPDDSYGTSPRCRNARIHPVCGCPSAVRCTASDAAR